MAGPTPPQPEEARPRLRLTGKHLRDEVMRMRGEGMSQTAIAAVFGCSRAYICKICGGVTPRANLGRPRVRVEIPEDVLERMCEALRGGMGVGKLLELEGVAECFPTAKSDTESQRVRLGQFILGGERKTPMSAARRLWRARDEGTRQRAAAAA